MGKTEFGGAKGSDTMRTTLDPVERRVGRDVQCVRLVGCSIVKHGCRDVCVADHRSEHREEWISKRTFGAVVR